MTNNNGGLSPVTLTPFAATFDEANRMTSITLAPLPQTGGGAGGEGAGGTTYALTYDANGNLIRKQNTQTISDTTIYTWDARGKLTQITGPNGSASFKYDALGRRVEKSVSPPEAGGVAQSAGVVGYLYDGDQAIAELQGNSVTAAYHTGLEIDEVLARYSAAGNKTLLTDALMSVTAQADDAGQVQNYYAYSPYGEAQTLGPDDNNPLQYTGRENDKTGLYYYRARYYDPLLKRFISEDPIGLAGGMNVYTYVGGNPVSFTDPEGLRRPIRELIRPLIGDGRPETAERQARRYEKNKDKNKEDNPYGDIPNPNKSPWCRTICPNDGNICRPVPTSGIPSFSNKGCYEVCSPGPYMSSR